MEAYVYPYFRVAKILFSGLFKPGLDFSDISELKMRVWPSDLDTYPEMNNGRHLTLMDLGRYDLAARTGLWRKVRHQKWGFVIAGASVRYRRKLPPFRRFILRTRLVGHDTRWFYFRQETLLRGKVASQALIRAGVLNRSGVVPIRDVLALFGRESLDMELPGWVRDWIAADEKRPKM
jgi:acyl-CoA thioesterase FadM